MPYRDEELGKGYQSSVREHQCHWRRASTASRSGELIMKVKIATIFVIAAGLAGGCGRTSARIIDNEDMTKVTGKITLDNVPLTVGEVCFQSGDRTYVRRGPIDSTGNYVVKGMPVGQSRVFVSSANFSGEEV